MERIIERDAGIIMLQEPGDLQMEDIQDIKTIMTRICGKAKVIYQRTGSRYGGVMTILKGTWVHRYQTHKNDERKLNRFHTIRIRGKAGKQISIINIYRPHFQSTGSNSVAEESRRYLDKQKLDDTNPEKLWEDDFKEIVENELTDAIIVSGDFNKRIDERIRAWDTLEEKETFNVLRWKYEGNIPPTRIPGEKGAIDHVIISNTMKVVQAAIEEPTLLSDHVPISITILGHELFYYINQRSTIGDRIMTSHNPRAIKRFREILERSLKMSDITVRLEKLYDKFRISRDSIEHVDKKELSEIVEEVDRITIEAEERALGTTKGQRNLSRAEKRIRYEILSWNKIVSWCKNPDKSRIKKTRMKKILTMVGRKECEVNTIDITNARAGLKSAWDKWKENVESRWRSKDEWRLFEEASGLQTLGDMRQIDTIIETLKHQYQMKSSHKRIKRARGKDQGEGLTILEIEEEDGRKSQVYQKEQIERIALQECHKKVHTADVTTLWQAPTADWIKIREGPDAWRRLFLDESKKNGITGLPISKGAKLFLIEMSKHRIQEELQMDDEQYWNSWKIQREATASYGKIHFSHFKCVTKNSLANSVRSTISNIRLKFGITPNCYKQATDLLLLKSPNDFRPHRMRLITLQHAASNHDFKYIGKKISEIGEKRGYFSECQYGSRKNKSAAIQALNKCLMLDISRIQKKSIVLIANDAKSCYDRVILWVMYFVMRRFGLTHNIAKMAVETIQEMTHSVSTIHGQSEATYGGKGSEPNGLLQGNGMAAQMWAAISSILFQIYEASGHGARIKSAISGCNSTIAGFAFVDDTDLVEMARDNESDEELIQRTQEGINLWNELIEVTGGALEPRKTDWCIMTYRKDRSKWNEYTKDYGITIQDEISKERIELKKLLPGEARRTLGIWQACDGNQSKQEEILIESIERYGRQIKKSGLSRREKEIALKSTITRTIAYGAQATTLNAQQSERVSKALRKAAIQGLGLAKSTATAIIHGPKSKNGMEVMQYQTYQMTEHIKVLLNHLNTNSRTGELLQAGLELHTLELGMEGSIWELKNPDYLCMMSESWIKNTLEAMMKFKIRIRDPKASRLKMWRVGDKTIMDMIIKSPGNKLSPHQLRDVQEVRRYLKVITLSDILIEGRIDKNTWEGRYAQSSVSKNKYSWMTSAAPSQEEIKHWQLALNMIGIIAPGVHIPNTLGSWFKDAFTEEAWIDMKRETIQRTVSGVKRYYKRRYSQRNRDRYGSFNRVEENTDFVPEAIARITTKDAEEIVLLEETKGSIERQEEDIIDTIHTTVVQADTLGYQHLGKKIKEGKATLATDASDDKKGNLMAAFCEELTIEEEENSLNEIQGWAQIPSKNEDTDSYRGELGGILLAIRFIKTVAKQQDIIKGKCKIKADNKEAINRVQSLGGENYPSCMESSFDLLRIIHSELHDSVITFEFQWVRGHQDRTIEYIQLDDEARANCRADHIASSKIQGQSNIECPTMDIKEGPSLWIENKKIHSKIYKNILEHIEGSRLREYWKLKNRHNSRNENNIDWKALEHATHKFKFSDQIIITKILADIAPTAKTLHSRGEYLTGICELCESDIETTTHVFQCKHMEMKEKYEQLRQQMRKNLKKGTKINEERINTIMQYMQAVRDNDLDRINRCVDLGQQDMGRMALFNGIIHKEMRDNNDGITGSQRLIQEILQFRIQMWKHRCELVHNKEKNRKRVQKLQSDYRYAMGKRPKTMNEVDSARYKMSEESFNSLTITEKTNWIEAMVQVRKKYERLAKKGLLRYWPQPKTEKIKSTAKVTMEPDNTKRRKLQWRRTNSIQQTLRSWIKRKMTSEMTETKSKKQKRESGTRQMTQVSLNDTKISATQEAGEQEHKKRKREHGKITWWINKQRNPGE